MTLKLTLLVICILFTFEFLYFKLAKRFKIIDKPNGRSSHSSFTIRGGGIIFSISAILFFIYYDFRYPYFLAGLILISIISFLDDLHSVSNKIRLIIHLMSVILIFYQWNIYQLPWYWIIIILILIIGIINAYNFMDGINGITGSYSILTIGTLYIINTKIIQFTSKEFLIFIGISLLVFNFFNFRKKAKCFAGDVGSVSIAFIIIFFIGQLILKTENFTYILLLIFYGLDSITTIIFRFIKGENIFVAHRNHFYQYLANEMKLSHLYIALIYFLAQFVVNVILVLLIKNSIILAVYFTFSIATIFVGLRFVFEGRIKLFQKG